MAKRLVIALLSAALGLAVSAAAQDVGPSSPRADPFSALIGKRQPSAEREAASASVQRFVIASDDRAFLFQPGEREGRIKFLCGRNDPRIDCLIDTESPAEEIFLLTPMRASRGDVAWNDRRGETLLRVAAYGGVTVHWPGGARSLAASKSFGEDPPLTLGLATIETARARAQRATALISARVGAPVLFEIGTPSPDSEGGASVLADAVVRAASGMARVADDPTGARVIAARIQRVEFASRDPGLGVEKGVLTVGYDPDRGVEGRPSSAAIAKFLEESL